MARNDQETNWMSVGLAFVGCFVTGVAIGQITGYAAWSAIGLGVGLVMVGVVHAISSRD